MDELSTAEIDHRLDELSTAEIDHRLDELSTAEIDHRSATFALKVCLQSEWMFSRNPSPTADEDIIANYEANGTMLSAWNGLDCVTLFGELKVSFCVWSANVFSPVHLKISPNVALPLKFFPPILK